MKAVRAVRDQGCTVKKILTIVDRGAGRGGKFEKREFGACGDIHDG